MAELGLIQWRLRQGPVAVPTAHGQPQRTAANVAEPMADRQAVTNKIVPTKIATTGDGARADVFCSIVLPAQASGSLRRVCGDIIHFLNLRDVPCRRLDADALEVLPQAPALCFYPHITQAQQDDAGRLQLPVTLDAMADGDWKPVLWAYLQNLLAD